MKIILSFLRFFTRFYWVKKEIVIRSKNYLMNYHIFPIIDEIIGEKIFDGDYLNLKDAINSDAFKNGIIDHFLCPNNYMLSAKDIAIAINMGVFGHSSESFLKDPVIDASFYMTKKLKERFLLDDNLKYVLNELGKNISDLQYGTNRDEIKAIFEDKKLIFEHYFNIYKANNYTEKITVYYPGYGKTWIEWKEDESLQISVYKYDIPRGFFLCGFDYKSDKNGWLSSAIRTKDKEFFNPSKNIEGDLIWLK